MVAGIFVDVIKIIISSGMEKPYYIKDKGMSPPGVLCSPWNYDTTDEYLDD